MTKSESPESIVNEERRSPGAATADVASDLEKTRPRLARLNDLIYPAALLTSTSIWLLAIRAPLWLDETLAYWQVSGGFWKIWSRSQLMPSSIGYLYTLWLFKSLLGAREIALKIPSTLAMLGAVYFLFRAARELLGQEIAFIVCIFFCLETSVVFAATDARPYAFALLTSNLAIFAFTAWMRRRRMRQAIGFGAAAGGILYFHYLFAAILPAFVIYYMVVRYRSIRRDARQLAAVVASFTLVTLPLVYRVLRLYHTRETHVVQELRHPVLAALNTLAPKELLIGFVATLFLAALLRKIKLPGHDRFPQALLCALLAVVPAGMLFGISAATQVHLVIPRYFSVVAPGSALTWGLLTSFIDSGLLRKVFTAGLAAITAFQCFSSSLSRRHELNFKQAHAFVNANVADEKGRVPVLICSAFIESNFEPLPTDQSSENALASQLSYYPVHAPVVFLPMSVNDETLRIGGQAVLAAAQKHTRFLAVAPPSSYETIKWLSAYSRGQFAAKLLGEFDEIVVVEFRPATVIE